MDHFFIVVIDFSYPIIIIFITCFVLERSNEISEKKMKNIIKKSRKTNNLS